MSYLNIGIPNFEYILGCQDIADGIFPPLALWKILLFGAPNFEGL